MDMSIPLVAEQRAAFRRGAVPAPRQVTDGVWSIPVPLTGSPLVSMTMYLVETAEGLVLIDAGYDDGPAWRALLAGLEAAGAAPSEVRTAVLTHNHPDHIGLADRLRREGGTVIAVHPLDCFAAQRSIRGGFLDQLERSLRIAGVPEAETEAMMRSARRVARHDESLVPDLLVTEGELPGGAGLEVLHTPGHTYGHVSLLDRGRRLLFTGDLVMPSGETQLAPVSLEEDDPFRDLSASLRRIGDLAVDLVLPGHQYPIEDHARRTREAEAARGERLAEVERAARSAGTAWEVAALLTWPRPWADMRTTAKRFAVVQTLGHLRALQRGGSVPGSAHEASS